MRNAEYAACNALSSPSYHGNRVRDAEPKTSLSSSCARARRKENAAERAKRAQNLMRGHATKRARLEPSLSARLDHQTAARRRERNSRARRRRRTASRCTAPCAGSSRTRASRAAAATASSTEASASISATAASGSTCDTSVASTLLLRLLLRPLVLLRNTAALGPGRCEITHRSTQWSFKLREAKL